VVLSQEDAINLAGKEHLSNKVIIDTTNPIAAVPPENGVIRLFYNTWKNHSMEKIQKILPDAKVVKAFSCVGNAFMYKPNFNGSYSLYVYLAAMMTQQKKLLQIFSHHLVGKQEDMGKWKQQEQLNLFVFFGAFPVL
jgi:hypothetical protein